MLPSIINNMNGNISCYTDQTPFSNLYHFPYETDNNNEFYLQQYQDLPLITTSYNYNPTSAAEANHVIHNMVDHSNKNSTRKRFSKKDRHSKINTAQGPRDRRMRLSLEIARQFFALQDMLGFDKASKTVEWLLSKAKLDINKLVAKSSGDRLFQTVDYSSSTVVGAKTASSSASECEVISGTDPHVFTDQNPSKCVNKKEKIRLREVRKAAFRPVRARESREKARERARERTNYKKKMCEKSKLFAEEDATTNQDSNQVGSSWSPMSLEALHERGHVGATTDMVDDDHSLAITDKWSPTSIIMTYLHGSTGFPQEHQFGDFHFYNIQSLL